MTCYMKDNVLMAIIPQKKRRKVKIYLTNWLHFTELIVILGLEILKNFVTLKVLENENLNEKIKL